MKRLSILALALLAFAGAARASVVPLALAPKAVPGSEELTGAEEQVKALEKEYEAAQKAVQAKLKELATNEERSKYRKEHDPDVDEFAERFLALADKHPKSEACARALAWVSTRVEDEDLVRRTVERLASDHASSPYTAKVFGRLEVTEGAWVDELLDGLVDSSKSAEVRGGAMLSLARRAIEGPGTGSKRTAAQAEALLVQIVEQYADAGGGKLRERAERELFSLRNLTIGKIAPDIEGEDLDGVRFKLSDYRGKVVVVDFWGNW